MDEGNYMGHVFAGLAGLELGRYEEAKQHYKTAIAAQPDEPLAWKVWYMYGHIYTVEPRLLVTWINKGPFLPLYTYKCKIIQ